jgi:hypothetical protein
VWAALPFTVGPALADALEPSSTAVRAVASTVAWTIWAVVLVASLVPRTTSLTIVRIGAPAALAAAAWGALGESVDARDVVALAWGVLTMAVALAAPTADAFVNGSSYGPECRLALRTPGPLLFGPVPLAWAVVAAGVVTGPLLLAAHSWFGGALAVAIGWPAAAVAIRAIHTLSRRWVVFVPAGMVLHDRLALTEPMLFPRALVQRLAPAEAGTGALDLTGRALGLVLHLTLTEAVTVGVARGRRPAELVGADQVLFTPGRPGALLAEARARRLPVG